MIFFGWGLSRENPATKILRKSTPDRGPETPAGDATPSFNFSVPIVVDFDVIDDFLHSGNFGGNVNGPNHLVIVGHDSRKPYLPVICLDVQVVAVQVRGLVQC